MNKEILKSILEEYDMKNNKDKVIDEFLNDFDINSIPKELRNKQYKDYEPIIEFLNNVSESRIYENWDNPSQQEINVESTRNIIECIKDHLELDMFQFKVYSPHKVCIVEVSKIPYHYQTTFSVLTPIVASNINIVVNEMRKGGYYKIREKVYTDEDDEKWIMMIFDPIKQDSVTEQIKKTYPYIFHTTELKNKESIVINGLKPQNNTNPDFHYNEPRVYLYYGSVNDTSYINMMKNIANSRKKNDKTFDGTYVQFTIDTDNLPDDVEFFDDPHGDKCVYTRNTIPPDAIIKTKIVKY